MADEDAREMNSRKWQHPAVILAGTIVLGALGSGLWDIAVKPCFTWLVRTVLDFLSFGTTFIKDYVYSKATLDQTSVPSAQVFTIAIACLTAPVVFLLLVEFGIVRLPSKRRSQRKPQADELTTDRADENEQPLGSQPEELNAVRRNLSYSRRIALIVNGLLIGIVVGKMTLDLQSLEIWRAFHADMRICAPYLSDDEEEALHSKYAMIRSKADFETIADNLRAIAKANGLRLHLENLW